MTPEDILNFWFVQSGPKMWFAKSDAFDADIRRRFEEVSIRIAAKCAEGLHKWEARPESTLALILALDQFPRNMYRNTPAAFAWDETARLVAQRLVDKGWDLKLSQMQRSFAYLPFEHSERLEDQDKSVKLFESRIDDANMVKYARTHYDVIKEFGRFPHRNAIIGRESTAEETAFLEAGGFAV